MRVNRNRVTLCSLVVRAPGATAAVLPHAARASGASIAALASPRVLAVSATRRMMTTEIDKGESSI